MTTIKDIARQAGVTPGVVSRALNNKYGVKPSTKEKIQKIALELGYYPNTAARSLVTRRSDTIGIMMADISEPFYAQIIKGMEYVANQTGHTLLFSNSYESVEHNRVLQKMIFAERVDGLIIVGSNIQEKNFVFSLLEEKFPFVLIERNFSDPSVNCICVDNVYGAYLATNHLIEREHRKIAHLAGNFYNQVTLDRIEGYKKALEEAGIGFSPEWIHPGNFNIPDAYKATKEILRQGCTGIFAASDTMAYGVLRSLAEEGLSAPEDIAVVGYDDLDFSELCHPPLTTIRQPRHAMGVKSMELLTAILRNEHENGAKICLTPELVVRNST